MEGYFEKMEFKGPVLIVQHNVHFQVLWIRPWIFRLCNHRNTKCLITAQICNALPNDVHCGPLNRKLYYNENVGSCHYSINSIVRKKRPACFRMCTLYYAFVFGSVRIFYLISTSTQYFSLRIIQCKLTHKRHVILLITILILVNLFKICKVLCIFMFEWPYIFDM